MAVPTNPTSLEQVTTNAEVPDAVYQPSAGTASAVNQVTAIANGQTSLPASGTYTPTLLQDDPSLLQNADSTQLNDSNLPGATVTNAQQTQAEAAPKTDANTYDATKIGSNAPQATAATVQNMDAEKAVAAQAEVDPRSTVKGQLTELYNSDPSMTWAAGAVRKANEAMAARGLQNSSLAGQAITQAVMESALPIAQAEAAVFGQFQLANLNNRQQAALQNAQMVHADNIANLTADQQTRLANQQAAQQALLSDQAQQNAAKQFNAASQNQTDQFFATLQSQISQYNAGQANALSQFNAGQSNAFQQFQQQLANQREQFNVQQRAAIEQSNFTWRRQINTANTAAQNQAAQLNAQNSLNLSNWALAAKWQEFRDEADYAFNASESAKNRQYGVAAAFLSNAFKTQAVKDQQAQDMYTAVGGFTSNLLNNLLG